MSEVKTLNILNNVYENINNLELLNSLKIISQKIEKFDNASDLAAKALADKAIADKSASDAKIAADKAIEDAKKTNVNINQVWDENEKKLKEAKEKDTKDEKNKKIVPSNVEPKINTEEYVKWIFVAFAIFIAILMIFSFIYYIFFYNSNVPQNDENYNSIINNDNNLYNSNNSSSINNQYNQELSSRFTPSSYTKEANSIMESSKIEESFIDSPEMKEPVIDLPEMEEHIMKSPKIEESVITAKLPSSNNNSSSFYDYFTSNKSSDTKEIPLASYKRPV